MHEHVTRCNVTAIVCCHNEGVDVVRDCLLSLNELLSLENIIVISNGNTSYSDLVDDLLCDRWIALKRNEGITQLRNTGLSICETPYIMFIDGHMIFREPTIVLARLQAAFNVNLNIGIVTGVYTTFDSKGAGARHTVYNSFSGKTNLKRMVSSDYQWYTTTGGISIYRTALLKRIKGFPERYVGSACEDIFVQLVLEGMGYYLVVDPHIVLIHNHPMSLKKFYTTAIVRNSRGKGILLLDMILRRCKPRFKGYVCEVPWWALAPWFSTLFLNPVVILLVFSISLGGMYIQLFPTAFKKSGSFLTALHASSGYGLSIFLKVPWAAVFFIKSLVRKQSREKIYE